LAALAMAVALGGCADTGWDSANFFRKPVDVVGRSAGYTYSDLQESRLARPMAVVWQRRRRKQRPVAQPAVRGPPAQTRRRLARAWVSA
jgi:hypothetical protein